MVLLVSSRKRSTSFKKEADGEFRHQVGGHHELVRLDRFHVAKPSCTNETDFYLNTPAPLRAHVPHFCAYAESDSDPLQATTSTMCENCLVNGAPTLPGFHEDPSTPKRKSTKSSGACVVLSDLTSTFRRPSIVDLKMGTRQHGDAAAPEKIRRQTDKCARSTSLMWGIRLCGLQYYDATTGRTTHIDKYEGRTIEIEELWRAVRGFLSYPDGRPREAVIRGVIRQIEQIEEAITLMDGVRLFGSSLLIVYEGDALEEPQSEAEAEQLVSVRVVDFANATLAGGNHVGADQGFLLGVHSFNRFVAALLHPGDSDIDSEGSCSP